MIFERLRKEPDGSVSIRREVQLELAEWVQVGEHVFARRVREWS